MEKKKEKVHAVKKVQLKVLQELLLKMISLAVQNQEVDTAVAKKLQMRKKQLMQNNQFYI